MLDRTNPDDAPGDAQPAAEVVVHGAIADAPLPPARPKRSLRLPLMLGGVLAVFLGAGYFWLTGGRYVGTDDAYVRAAKLMVSTDVSGLVTRVAVREGQSVGKGDILFQVDPHAFQISLDNAKANLDEVALSLRAMEVDYQRMLSDIAAQESAVANDKATFDRYDVLVKANTAISKATYDQARFTLTSSERKLDSLRHQADVQLARLGGKPDMAVEQHPQYLQAKAAVDEAQRQLDHATVKAPFSGIATAVDTLQPGLYLVAQTAALSNQGAIGLVSTDDVWVEANLKETDLTHVKVGDPVSVTVDTYPGVVWQGTVDSISPASGAEFAILPAQNASGNWVKVVQRIPVRIKVERKPGDPRLRAGLSVNVSIDTGHSRSLADLF